MWKTISRSSKFPFLRPSPLVRVLRVIVESAMLQLVVEVLLLIFQSLGLPIGYVFLYTLVPIIVRCSLLLPVPMWTHLLAFLSVSLTLVFPQAITFNSLTLYLKLWTLKDSLGPVPFPDPQLGIRSSGIEDISIQPIRISVDVYPCHRPQSDRERLGGAPSDLDVGRGHGK